MKRNGVFLTLSLSNLKGQRETLGSYVRIYEARGRMHVLVIQRLCDLID